ncbi:MAG: C10 family peptidase [Candidatus Cloacimonetes bacterium]|nr:C10 family peptidase [Candidatus Cloacimonadota bacterium]
MKKVVISVCMLIMLSLLFSELVPQATILEVATKWIELQTQQPRVVDNYAALPNASDPLYYMINFNQGFVFVSADDCCIPILAFCTEGSYTVDPVNEDAEYLLLEYSLQIEDAKNNNRSNTDTLPIWNAIINQTIGITEQHDIGLETPQWGGSQGIYNVYCPLDDSTNPPVRSVVGCVATAAAQILNYYKHWNYTLVESDRYTSSSIYGFECEIDLDAAIHDFPDFTTLNGYMDEVKYKFNNNIALSDNDKAALSFACGILVGMDYSSSGSSAHSGKYVYDKTSMYSQWADKSIHSYSDEAWINLIKNQLLLNRPIEYAGYTLASAGHAYIISGFQTTNMNTTLNLVNWGRPWCYPEYWSLQPINPVNPYPYQHSMLYGIAPSVPISQTIELGNGSTDYSGIRLDAIGHDGVSATFTSDNGVFEFRLPPGTYDFTITDVGNYFNPIQICDISIEMGINHISPGPIVLTLRPYVVVVPTDVPTIQDGIDLVRNGGTVAILDGSYTASGLNWQGKHIKLQGETQNGVFITNNPTIGLPAITLSGIGIDNQDIISRITFLDCDLTEEGQYRRGAAIELVAGAAPIISNCTFYHNRVGNPSTSNLILANGVGGAVFVIGGVSQTDAPRFEYCTFTDNYTLNGNGGGAVALYGQAQFTGCEFTNNSTIVTDGIENPTSRDMGGAVFVYSRINHRDIDIDFDNCNFYNNQGRSEADDVFVANTEKLNDLLFRNCTFAADTPHDNGAKPAIKFLTDTVIPVTTHAHLILTDNRFLSSRKGAVYFCDYWGKNRLTFTRNVIANNIYDGYGVYSWYPDGTPPENTDYFVFDNNTFSNIHGSGLVLFQSAPTTINNTVFENCSSYGIRWGDYEEGHPDWRTRGLTTNHCLFSPSSPRYDFGGNTSSPLIENSVMSVQEMHLDNNYHPIWNSEVKSICIDNGNPDTNGDGETWLTDHSDRDADGTQKDIGAIPLLDGHIHRFHRLTSDKIRYISIPGVVNYPESGEQNLLYHVFHEFRGNGLFETYIPVLHQITWKYNDEGDYANPTRIPEHYVHSQNGYKVTLTENAQDLLIQYQGYFPNNPMNKGMFIQDLDRYTQNHYILPPGGNSPVDSNTGIPYREIYLGYYLSESLMPFDALNPIMDNVTAILAEDWAMVRLPIFDYNPEPGDEPSDAYTDTWLGCFPTGGREITINPGEMVVVRYIGSDPIEFKLGGDNPNPPFTDPYYREMATHFEYEEQPEYIPIFLSIDLNQFEDGDKPLEVAVFIDEECKGAAVIKEGEVQLNAYITNVDDPTEELKNLEFRMFFPGKAANAHVLDYSVLNKQSGRFESRKISVSESKEFLQIRLGKTEEPPLPSVTKLFGNYPNPFNPETTISFDLAEQCPVTIEVFNIKGQKVRTLVRDSYAPGHHSVVWNGTDAKGRTVSSGVYFYRMITPTNTLIHKMLLMK